jgi:RNA polymerase sigma factor (sigma-70 family)
MLRLAGDDKLVAMIRAGHDGAFEVLFERYHSRLLAFTRHMLRSTEDAEDVLQEVFFKAHAAMLADERPIKVRPWLYRIARNRALNHLRKPVAEGQDSMDVMPSDGGASTAERVQTREDFRALVADVQDLPETQRTALLLREIDALSYEEIAEAMDTTVPAVKSLLVRARISLAEATQSRLLTCGEVQLELAEAAEGLRKASGPARHHLKQCEPCTEFRRELRSNSKALAALAPIGPLAALHSFLTAKFSGLFGGSGSAAGGGAAGSGGVAGGSAVGGAAAAGGAATGGGAMAGGGAIAGGAAAAGGSGLTLGGAAVGAGGIGGAIGAKAAATAATAALLTAGAVEVRNLYNDQPERSAKPATAQTAPATRGAGDVAHARPQPVVGSATAAVTPAPDQAKQPPPAPAAEEPAPAPAEDDTTAPTAPADDTGDGVVGAADHGEGSAHEEDPVVTGSGTGDPVVVAVVTPTDPQPGTDPSPSEPPPASTPTTEVTGVDSGSAPGNTPPPPPRPIE